MKSSTMKSSIRLKEFYTAYKITCTECGAVVKSRHGPVDRCTCGTDIHWSTKTILLNRCPWLSEGGVFYQRKEI